MLLIALISKDVFLEKSRSVTAKRMILALIYSRHLDGFWQVEVLVRT